MNVETLAKPELEEFYLKYEQTLRYLDRAMLFKKHSDKLWIKENTLARWLYIGSKQAIEDIEKEAKKYDLNPTNFMKKVGRRELNDKLSSFKFELKICFPEDELIRGELVK